MIKVRAWWCSKCYEQTVTGPEVDSVGHSCKFHSHPTWDEYDRMVELTDPKEA